MRLQRPVNTLRNSQLSCELRRSRSLTGILLPVTWFSSLSQARIALAAGTAFPSEILAGCLGRIDVTEATIRAWIHLDREGAAARASELDAGLQSTEPLWGIPVGVKDIID